MNQELQIVKANPAGGFETVNKLNVTQFPIISGQDESVSALDEGLDVSEEFVVFSAGKNKGFEFKTDPSVLYKESRGKLVKYLGDCILDHFAESLATPSSQAIFLDKAHPIGQEFTSKQLMKVLRVPDIQIGGKRTLRTAVIEYIDGSLQKTVVTGFTYLPFSYFKSKQNKRESLEETEMETSTFSVNRILCVYKFNWLDWLGGDCSKDKKKREEKPELTVTRLEAWDEGISALVEDDAGYIKINTYSLPNLEPTFDSKNSSSSSKAKTASISSSSSEDSEDSEDSNSINPLVDHILYLCDGDQEDADHLIDWLAFNVQFPERKIKHAVLLGSAHQGTGKSMLIDVMRQILGSKNTNSIGIKDIANGKQNWLVNCVFIAVEEVKDISPSQMNKLKSLITEETVNVDIKFGKYGEEKNFSNFLFTSNERRSLYLDESDRRYFVLFSEAKPKEPEYYSKLNKWLTHEGGINEFYGMLLSHELQDFNPDARPPMTDAKQVLITDCIPDLDLWIRDWSQEKLDAVKSFSWEKLVEGMNDSPYRKDASRTKYIKKTLENNGLVSSRTSVKGVRSTRWHKEDIELSASDFFGSWDDCPF